MSTTEVLEVLEAGRPYTHDEVHEVWATLSAWFDAEHDRIMAELYPEADTEAPT